MPKYLRLDVLNEIIHIGIIPVFYHADFEVAKKIVTACAEGGARVIEFTNRGDNAYRVFSDLVSYFSRVNPSIVIGAGSVLDEATAGLYISSGANFIVGPVLNPELARICNRRKVVYCPGCGSISEISQAEELGVEIVKVFPGDSVGGPNFVKAILGPMPWSRIMLTGGVDATKESITAWFNSGVAAVGIGSNLIRKEWVQTENYEAISDLTAKVIDWGRSARGLNIFTGIEHTGFSTKQGCSLNEVAEWYRAVFGFQIYECTSSIFVKGDKPGQLEVSLAEDGSQTHVAVSVSNFEMALEELHDRGIELEEPLYSPDTKIVFLKQTDPNGIRVHLVWRLHR